MNKYKNLIFDVNIYYQNSYFVKSHNTTGRKPHPKDKVSKTEVNQRMSNINYRRGPYYPENKTGPVNYHNILYVHIWLILPLETRDYCFNYQWGKLIYVIYIHTYQFLKTKTAWNGFEIKNLKNWVRVCIVINVSLIKKKCAVI